MNESSGAKHFFAGKIFETEKIDMFILETPAEHFPDNLGNRMTLVPQKL